MSGGLSWRRAFAVSLVAIAFLALNTGASLAYLLFALLAGSAYAARRGTLRAGADLAFARRIPDRCEAGTPFRVELLVRNGGRRGHALVRVVERAGESPTELWFAGIPADGTLAAGYEVMFARRGMAFFPSPLLSVPAAFECARPSETGAESFALLHPRPAEPPPLLAGLVATHGLMPVDLPGDADFAGLSRAPEGERASRLHWAAYARTGEAHRKVFRERTTETLLLFLLAADPFALERGVALAAGCAKRLREEGVRFLFGSFGEKRSRAIDGADERSLLDHLALLPPRTIPLTAERAGAAIASFRMPRVLALLPWSYPEPDDAIVAAAGPDILLHIHRYEPDDHAEEATA